MKVDIKFNPKVKLLRVEQLLVIDLILKTSKRLWLQRNIYITLLGKSTRNY